MHFMDDSFVNLWEYYAGWEGHLKKNGSIPTCYDNLMLLSQRLYVCLVISLSICYWLFKCGVLRIVFVCVRERGREIGSHHSTSAVLTVAYALQIHTSIIAVSVTRLGSPFGLELMVKLRTLLTVFTFILKAEARDYSKGRFISN